MSNTTLTNTPTAKFLHALNISEKLLNTQRGKNAVALWGALAHLHNLSGQSDYAAVRAEVIDVLLSDIENGTIKVLFRDDMNHVIDHEGASRFLLRTHKSRVEKIIFLGGSQDLSATDTAQELITLYASTQLSRHSVELTQRYKLNGPHRNYFRRVMRLTVSPT